MWVYWSRREGEGIEFPRFFQKWDTALISREIHHDAGLITSGIYYTNKKSSARDGEFTNGGIIPIPKKKPPGG